MMRVLSTLLFLLALGGCTIAGPQPGEIELRTGIVEEIRSTEIASNHHQGIGAVLGGIGGLGIGSLIGGGTGRDVAMIAGTIGGALLGNESQKRYDRPTPAQQVIVRLRNGVLLAVTQPVGADLRVGQLVYVQGSGESARVVPQ